MVRSGHDGSDDASTFERAVDAVLRELEPGELMTYGEVAQEAGFPGAGRAVGRLLAMSGDRYPWWRVVTAQGRLVPGGEAAHRAHLLDEGHEVTGDRVRLENADDR